MRVLFVSCFYEYRFGGAELVMRKLRQQLQSRGHQIDLLCLGGGPETQPGNIWRMPPPPLMRQHPQWMKRAILFLNNPAFDRWMLRSVRTFPRAPYDLVHCQDVHSVILAQHLASRLEARSGLTVQDNVPRQCAQATGNRLVTAILQTCVRLRDRSLRPCLRQFDWITAPSNHVARGLAQFLKPHAPPIFTIHSPHPGALPSRAPSTHKAEPRLLFLGRLSREKGIELLLDALSRYSNPFQLTVLGLDGPLTREVQRRAHRDPRIHLYPPVPHGEVDRLLQAHDVVCCLSLWDDPLPGSVIEARLHGKAILATDKGGIPEILAGYGKSVILKTRGLNRAQRVEACLSALPKVIQLAGVAPDPSEEAAFVQRFSPSHFADQFEALYRQGPHHQSVVLPLQS